MKKDDYHVIIYKILAYLYTQLKNGDDVDAGMISNDGKKNVWYLNSINRVVSIIKKHPEFTCDIFGVVSDL